MEMMYFLIPVSMLILVAVTGLLIWAVNSGQYEDIEREGERILQDDDLPDHGAPEQPAGPDAAQADDTKETHGD